MTISRKKALVRTAKYCVAALGLFVLSAGQAAALTVNVVDNDGNSVNGFRWLVQEDTTFPVDPTNPANHPDELLSLGFHTSYHPIARSEGVGLSGNTDGDSVAIDVPPGRYYVSVLPYSGYSISGAPVEIANGGNGDPVTVVVQQHPIPTAQISVYLFHDNYPINGAPDLPEETNPAPNEPGHVDWTQFSILVEEPAGRYGIAGGQVIQDAFGNPLGTTYLPNCNPNEFDCVATLGDGTLHPNADGFLTVKNLAPGKYGIVAIPATGSNWQQTSTIEGTKVIDAWVKAKEPPFFVEFGPPGPHVFIGFIKSTANGGFPALPGGATLTGTVTDMHMSRPPAAQFYSGRPFPGCWVALNDNNAGLGEGVWAGPCDGDSNFAIPNVPAGNYQMKVFDTNLDIVIATQGLTVDADGINCNGGTVPGCDFGEVAVFNWFARLNTGIFNDVDQDGFWDAGETGIGPESQDVSLRWRDGTVYQNFPTDNDGLAPFDEVFPFFHWLVAEVSFANKKATGATFVVDAGGPVNTNTDTFPGFGELNPQAQAENGGLPYRTETGPVLTTGFQGFLGQTSVMHFGKFDYVTFDFSTTPPTYVGENGGISGIVFYATTRAENEPQFAAAEEWEPGIPRVQVNLYADGDIDSFPLGDFPAGHGDVDWNGNGTRDLDDDIVDDVDGNGCVGLADVDNHPLGNFPGPEDVDRGWQDDDDTTATNTCTEIAGNGAFDLHDAVQVTWTDSWDDNLPTGCQGQNNIDATALNLDAAVTDDRCFDGLRNFNQIRPAVFDGGYAFADYDLGHLNMLQPGAAAAIDAYYDHVIDSVPLEVAETLQLGLLPGDYIVEAATPPGYKLMKEEDKNVDFGDEYIPSEQALATACVGDERAVPPYLSMTTKDGSGAADQLIAGIDPADAGAPYATELRPLCDRKKVPLSAAQNAATDFFLMTDVPVVANVSGVVLNDLANEFDPNSPSFGEKFAPPLLPIAFYDFNGKLVNRVHGDTFGRYNAVLPSTFTANLPQPSGMSPNMLISCMNDAGPIPDGNGGLMIDPFFDPQYSQFCYTFQYMPGAITYLDTPVVSVAAFTTPGAFPVDCERPTETPMVKLVTRVDQTGPFALPGEEIRIESMGLVDVPNPEWDGVKLAQKTRKRDYFFSQQTGNVFLEDADGNRISLDPANNQWNPNAITVAVPGDVVAGDYQVVVVNNDGTESPLGVTLTVGVAADTGERPDGGTYAVHRIGGPAPYPATPIQDAIDAAAPGDLILVPPGSYDELAIMWKPVKLQGWGAGAVFLNARQVPTEKIVAWRDKVALLDAAGVIDRLPGQELAPFGFPALAEALFPTEEGAGIFVVGKQTGINRFGRLENRNARIDGFTIVGASTGGGIVVNGYAQDLHIGNNRLTANAGTYGGGIRVGHPQLSHEVVDPNDPLGEIGDIVYDDAINDRIRIHHNHIVKNGGFDGAGGGISLHTGADAYRVQNNWVCGNFTQGDGAGIGHLGLSHNGLIEDNIVIFNESFAQANAQSGGGISVAGQPALVANAAGLLLTPGAGTVTIDANVVRGNLAGAGDGGGVRIAAVNGEDVAANLDDRTQWYRVRLFNNMITNNVAALAGGGVSIQDALWAVIRNNTVANNDSTATTAEAFAPGSPNESTPLPAGIVSRLHSPDLASLMNAVTDPDLPVAWPYFSAPVLRDNIVFANRSFYWRNYDDPNTTAIETGLFPASCFNPPNGVGCDVATTALEEYADDLGVLNGLVILTAPGDLLDPQFSLLTETQDNSARHLGVGGNITGDPAFVNGYVNGRRDNLVIQEFTTLQTAAAFDEGGNFIQVTFGPLSLIEPDGNPNNPEGPLLDYHLAAGSAAIGFGGATPATGRLSVDFDNDARGAGSDIGADEAQ